MGLRQLKTTERADQSHLHCTMLQDEKCVGGPQVGHLYIELNHVYNSFDPNESHLNLHLPLCIIYMLVILVYSNSNCQQVIILSGHIR